MNTAHNAPAHAPFARDFAPAVRRALLKRGITIIGICTIPAADGEMRWANGSRGYQLSDQGCFKIRTRAEVIALAAAPIGPRCPCCGTATAWGPASPWGDDPTPDTCVACDNANVRASEIA